MKAALATETPHPDFAVEALEALEGADPEEARRLLDVVHRLPEVLENGAAPSALRARLLEETSRAPERYSPFTRALSELYDLPRDEIRRVLEKSAAAGSWKLSGLPGIRKLAVSAGPACSGAQTYLVKFSAGVHFPEHRHDGLETVMLLAGSYTDDTGRVYDTGDTHVMQPGTAHAFTIAKDEDCVAATVLHGGLNFKSLPLRLLARLLGH